jgi:hypothetical protein
VGQKQEERRVAPALGGKGGCLGDAVNPRPSGGEIRQLLMAGEYFTLEIGLLAAEGRDAVLCVDNEWCHFCFSCTAVAVMAFITLKARNKQVNSAGTRKRIRGAGVGRRIWRAASSRRRAVHCQTLIVHGLPPGYPLFAIWFYIRPL